MSNKETKTDLPKETFCIERYDGKKCQIWDQEHPVLPLADYNQPKCYSTRKQSGTI